MGNEMRWMDLIGNFFFFFSFLKVGRRERVGSWG